MNSSLEDEYIWECQTNVDPWDEMQTAEWTPYSNAISSAIEKADKGRLKEILIDENYRIDLKHYTQKHMNDSHRQRPVRRRRRCDFSSTIFIDEESEYQSSLEERLSSPLGLPWSCSATADTTLHGSPFIHSWELMFTKGKMKVTFDTIFRVLLDGLIKEGQIDTKNKLSDIQMELIKVEKESHGKSLEEKMIQLEDCCARLYTKGSYIYGAINAALRDDDRTKLHTLGPFCYVLFNYIGRRAKNNSSIGDRFRGLFRSNEIHSIILYRGDRNSTKTVEEYQRAVGDKSKYFKWLPFVSTSRNRTVAENFARGNVLYIIEMRYYSLNEDQFTDLSICSDYPKEEEVLLLPGLLFQVNKLEFDHEKKIQLVYIKIKSSYISKLK